MEQISRTFSAARATGWPVLMPPGKPALQLAGKSAFAHEAFNCRDARLKRQQPLEWPGDANSGTAQQKGQ